MVSRPPLTLYFVRAQFAASPGVSPGVNLGASQTAGPGTPPATLDLPSSRLGRAVLASAPHYQPRKLAARHLPLSRLHVRPEALAFLDEALNPPPGSGGGAARGASQEPGQGQIQGQIQGRKESGAHAYLFTSVNAVRALSASGRLALLDKDAPLYCVGARALAALRALGFEGPALQAPTAAALENAIIEGPLRTLGCGQAPAKPPQWHYFCAVQVAHDFNALAAGLAALGGGKLNKHPIYAAQALDASDPRLCACLELIQSAPDQALMLVYSRDLARRLGAWLASASGGSDWRAALPVLCLSPAIAVELEAWDLRKIIVAQTPNEDGLAVELDRLLPGLTLDLPQA